MQARWCGLALLAAGLGMRLYATHFAFVTVEAVSLVPSLAGVFLLVGGYRMIRWAGPAILFLVFMFPLPTVLKENILGRLQRVATAASTYVMQTMGISAHREGNRIAVRTWSDDGKPEETLELGVVEACSGLRMSTIFVALAVAIVFNTDRPWRYRLVILLSAIPIALVVNVIRVTVTGVLYMLAGSNEFAEKVFHDWAGWFMMPLALGLLYVELQLLSSLVLVDESSAQLATVGPTPGRRSVPRPG
jgi:exosortase